ncbi:hypothetical protein BDV11DRAFT_189216 [Aspergillus similis]
MLSSADGCKLMHKIRGDSTRSPLELHPAPHKGALPRSKFCGALSYISWCSCADG